MATREIGSLSHKAILIDSSRTVQGRDVVVKGGQDTDYPAANGTRLPEGAVIVLESGDGLYYLATAASDGAHGDRNAAAVVTSIEKPDADWKDKTISWEIVYADGSEFSGSVLLGNGDDTIAEVVTALQADEEFDKHFEASDSGAADLLVITTHAKGQIRIKISADLDTAFASDDGASSSDDDVGTVAEYLVVAPGGQRDLTDHTGAALDTPVPVPTLRAGRFRRSALSFLTPEAETVLRGRGSLIED